MATVYFPPIDGAKEDWPYHFWIDAENVYKIPNWCGREFPKDRYFVLGFTVMFREASDAALFRLTWC